jgi:urease accessory protein
MKRFVAIGTGLAIAGGLAAPAALAHTGHPLDGVGDGIAHPLFGLDHLLAMVAVGVLAAFAGSRRIAWLTPIGFIGGMVLGGVAGMAGMPLPAGEALIAASVVLLGILVAVRGAGGGWWLPFIAAVFGVVHGHAHGAELPGGATPIAYAAGFLAATAVLHLSGTGLGLGLRRLPSLRLTAATALSATGVALLFAG